MSGRKVREFNINLEECYKLVRQNGTKGISATELARKMGKDRSTVYDYLNSLEVRERVQNTHGLWYAKTASTSNPQSTDRPLEKEIEIVLPMPRNKWADAARLQVHADYVEKMGLKGVAQMEKTILQKFDETRTIRIRGKNVDDLDLEKLGNLIQQATEKSSLFNLKGLLKGFKRSQQKTAASGEKPEDDKKSSET